MWLKKFKIALIEKNTDELEKLLDAPPKFENIEDAEAAMYLLAEASKLLHKLKNDTAVAMKQLKKNMDFLKSTEAPKDIKFDRMS